MIEIIDGTWAAGETKTFHIIGEYLELLDAQYPCDVYLMDKSGAQLSIMKKCEASFFSKPTGGFSTVQITSADAQYLRFFVGSGDAGTRRISSTVQVVDGGRARTVGGQAFMLAGGSTGVAGNMSGGVLWNPLGSGVRAILKAYGVSVQQAMIVSVAYALVNPYATPANFGNSKLAGGNKAKSRIYAGSAAATQVVPTQFWDYLPFAAAGSVGKTLQEPVVLNPGSGILFEGNALNATLNFTLEWVEESIA